MKKILAIFVACMTVLGMLAACSSGGSGNGSAANTPSGGTPVNTPSGGSSGADDSYEYPKLKLSLSTPSAEDTGKSYDCRLFIDKVTEASGGNITFTEYFNAALAKPTANLEAIGSGIADCGTVVNLYTPS